MAEFFLSFLDATNGFLYSKFLIAALIGMGVYFTICTRCVQLRLLFEAIRVVTEKKSHRKSISSFQALMIATASRVGTGNIAGVSTALVAGGPGAVVWMWIMCLIGGASAFVESTLAQIYKKKDGRIYKGGPAYYIQTALKARWLGIIFAMLLILCFAFGFNGLQSFNMTSALEYYTPNFAQSKIPMALGVLLAMISGYMFFGGAHIISRTSSMLVPVMAIIYIFIGMGVTVANIDKLPEMMAGAFANAFDFRAIFGGFAGSCVVIGIKRGLFSNEAGMGSAPNAAAAAEVSHPVKQGLVQVLSVFIDTLLICSTTAFIVLLSGSYEHGGQLNGIPLVQQGVASVFGELGVHLVTAAIFLFAFTSLIGNYFYAEANIKFISTNKTFLLIFRILAVLMIFVGAQVSMTTAWDLADVLMGLMATVNIIAVLLLGRIAFRALVDYEQQLKAGQNPVFKAENIGLHDTHVWK